MLLKKSIAARLALAWILGALGTFLGIYFSVLFDLPTGATMVCTFGGILILVAALRAVARPRLS